MVNESHVTRYSENMEKNYRPNSPTDSAIQRITPREIDIPSVLKSIDDGGVGAKVLFLGSVRNFSDNGDVVGMTYESYVGMAEEKIKNIEIDAKKTWRIIKIRRIIELAN